MEKTLLFCIVKNVKNCINIVNKNAAYFVLCIYELCKSQLLTQLHKVIFSELLRALLPLQQFLFQIISILYEARI